jgi:hypothetical protein
VSQIVDPVSPDGPAAEPTAAAQTPQRDPWFIRIRDEARKRPLFQYLAVMGTVILAVFGLAFGLAQVLVQQPHEVEVRTLKGQMEDQRQVHERQLADLERRLAGIDVGLTAADGILDVGALTIPTAQAASVGPESEFHPEQRFYALGAEASGAWSYTVASEVDLLADVTGLTREEVARGLGITPEQLAAMESTFPSLHLWRAPEDRVVAGVSGVRSLRASVFVQPFTHQQLRDIYRRPLAVTIVTEPSANLDDLYLGDAAGLVLLAQLRAEAEAVASNPTSLDSVQKRGNLVYAEFETTLRDVVVNDEPFDEYFWSRRVVIITTPSFVYLVKMTDASPDHRSPHAAWLNGWLASFRVLSD